jgi:SepF-like predicted cell division protein (DUF552 family)|tara:strand:+ start:74 stop:484 length:411 start_codon:yes stop_codon:yes gene_type:complete
MGFLEIFKPSKEEEEKIEADVEEGYVELDTDSDEEIRSKIIVRPFVMNDFESIKPILDSLREGKTIALVNIRPLKDKDLVELKRAINKLKKTTDAIDGEIAGFGEDYIVVAPSFAQIYRSKETTEVKSEPKEGMQE